MGVREFFKITGSKIGVFMVMIFLIIIYLVIEAGKLEKCTFSGSIIETAFRCNYQSSVFLLIMGILIFPFGFLNSFLSFYFNTTGNFSAIFIFILQLAYWYFLACFIVFIFNKILNRKKTNKALGKKNNSLSE